MRRNAQQISLLLLELSQVAITNESRAEAVGMRCPSCGTPSNQSLICGECGHNLVDLMNSSEFETCGSSDKDSHVAKSPASEKTRHNSRLIEFPGVSRSSVPGWRKEVAERVREAQERRAREALAEAQLAAEHSENGSLCQLELLPQAEVPPMNPLVAAALKRIERAYIDSPPAMARGSRRSRMAAVAYATESAFPSLAAEPLESPMTTPPTIPSATTEIEELPVVEEASVEVEKTHNLVVVPPAVIEKKEATPTEPKKRRRIISDDPHNPALNYLDSVSTTIHPEDITNRASMFRRSVAGVIDLLFLAVLIAPFALGLGLMNSEWQNIQTIAMATLTILGVSFLYSTISTAFTGRTLGMKLLSLRVVDARTGLIPTGRQSAGRAFVFNASLLTAGIVLAYALVDPEKRAAHDKITDTSVIQV